METSAIASMMDLLREVYMKAVLQMFSFLKDKPNGVAFVDPTEPEIDQTSFTTEDWPATPCCTCKEDVPSDDPAPIDTCFTMRAFVDSNHA